MRVRLTIIVSVLLGLCSSALCARRVQVLSYEELVARSNVVAIVEPLDNQTAQDIFPGTGDGHFIEGFVATNTRFKTHVLLKGDGGAVNELTVLHFSYSPQPSSILVNGPNLVRFTIGPLQYEKRAVREGKAVGGSTVFREEPVWLAFLKRRDDGRFEPVTGHFDSALSFRELHRPSFYAAP